jgi:nitrate reductase cytochrome c-type subunit
VKPRQHIPHHPHRVHHHHHHHRDKSVPQSAIQPIISNPFSTSHSFGDFLAKTTSAVRVDSGATSQEDLEKKEKQRREKKEAEDQELEKAKWREVENLRTKRTAVDE